MTETVFTGGFINVYMTGDEHTGIYRALAESVVAEPPSVQSPGLDERVQRGCELLDREYPGWADKINLNIFDLRSAEECVIGQVFGDYSHVDGVLNIETEDEALPVEEEHGFCLTDWTAQNDSGLWDRLENDWRVAIRERQTV